jgi:hypothetical protein
MGEWISGLIAAGVAFGLVVVLAAIVTFIVVRIFGTPSP